MKCDQFVGGFEKEYFMRFSLASRYNVHFNYNINVVFWRIVIDLWYDILYFVFTVLLLYFLCLLANIFAIISTFDSYCFFCYAGYIYILFCVPKNFCFKKKKRKTKCLWKENFKTIAIRFLIISRINRLFSQKFK